MNIRPTLAVKLLLPILAAAALTPALQAQGQLEEIPIGYLLSRKAGFNTADRAGASMGVSEVNRQAKILGKRFALLFAEGGHSTEVVAQAVDLMERRGVRVLMGSVSGAATVALARLAQERGVIFFNVGSEADSLRGSKCDRNTFHVGPSLTMRVRALGQWAVHGNEWKRWAIVEGTSRTEQRLAVAAQRYLAANGGLAAGIVRVGDAEVYDSGPVMDAIRGFEAEFVFVALTGERQEVFLESYQQAGLKVPVGGAKPELIRFGRRTVKAAGFWSTGWSHLNRIYGASELNNRYVKFAGIPMNERAWSAWAGVKILGEAILRVGSTDSEALSGYLRNDMRFDGYMGAAMSFRPWNNQLRAALAIVEVNHGADWNGWDAVVPKGRVPLRGLKGWKGNPMDSLGFTREESGCSF